jgi:hypothetical protein
MCSNYDEDDVYVFIFSWKKVTENAKQLFKNISPFFRNTFFINCDEHNTGCFDDLKAENIIHLDDSFYYGGQFQTALEKTPENKFMCCIVGDVNPVASVSWDLIKEQFFKSLKKAKNVTDKEIGIYAPNVWFTTILRKNECLWDEVFRVPNTDCTCWFIHPNILKVLRKIPIKQISNIGWGIDIICSKEADRLGMLVVRDYSVMVYQPEGTSYNKTKAEIQMNELLEYYNTLTITEK